MVSFMRRLGGTPRPTSGRGLPRQSLGVGGATAPSQGSAVLRFVTALIDIEPRMCYNALVFKTRKAECNDNYIHNAH